MSTPPVESDGSFGEVTTVDGIQLTIDRAGVVDTSRSPGETVNPEEVNHCLAWLRAAETAETPSLNSFWVKHVVQQWAGVEISNGALIMAAHQAGIAIGQDANSRNVNLGISSQSVDEFDCGCGPA